MRKALAAILLAAVTLCAGCGGVTTAAAKKPQTLRLTWVNDGNPTVPVCGTTKANCKANMVVIDLRTGVRTQLAITATSYSPRVTTDAYEVHVVGYDLNGHSIESVCCNVVVN